MWLFRRRIGLLTAFLGPSVAWIAACASGGSIPANVLARIHQIDNEKAAMVSAAKAKGRIQADFPADCARMEASASWAMIDQPSWNQPGSGPCHAVSHRLLIVLHRIHGTWQVAGSTTAFPSRRGCGSIA